MMRLRYLTIIALLSVGCTAALAQTSPPANNTGIRPGHEPGVGQSLPLSDKASNITPDDAKTLYAPTLPDVGLGDNASPEAYLQFARDALQTGHTGLAQQALEMAETRLLDRGVEATKVNEPSRNHRVAQIMAAREALGHGNIPLAVGEIDAALKR